VVAAGAFALAFESGCDCATTPTEKLTKSIDRKSALLMAGPPRGVIPINQKDKISESFEARPAMSPQKKCDIRETTTKRRLLSARGSASMILTSQRKTGVSA
jgi:hypothetical protein